jgi:hypothetical protein
MAIKNAIEIQAIEKFEAPIKNMSNRNRNKF